MFINAFLFFFIVLLKSKATSPFNLFGIFNGYRYNNGGPFMKTLLYKNPCKMIERNIYLNLTYAKVCCLRTESDGACAMKRVRR